MKRPQSHVIEDISEGILQEYLPPQWIVRKIPKDYGIDYEIEIVSGEHVTGNRIWIQLKGTQKLKVREEFSVIIAASNELYHTNHPTEIERVHFSVETKLLKYAQKCSFPLLLFVCDVVRKQIYWLPLQDYIERKLFLKDREWINKKTVVIYIPIENNLEAERKNGYPGLTWYALEPARMRAFALISHYVREIDMELGLIGYLEGKMPVTSINSSGLYFTFSSISRCLMSVLDMDVLFGSQGIEDLITYYKPCIEEGIAACLVFDKNIDNNKIRLLEEEAVNLMSKIAIATQILSFCAAAYQDNRESFLLID